MYFNGWSLLQNLIKKRKDPVKKSFKFIFLARTLALFNTKKVLPLPLVIDKLSLGPQRAL